MNETQLLCTFIPADQLEESIKNIQNSYTLAFNNIYVLENTEDNTQLILTYNVVLGSLKSQYAPPASTISVHRKKQTNTIYTINALNALIASKNGGKMDRTYKVNWDELKNSILVTAHGQLKVVKTKIQQIINL
jgi:hypothetical protein